MPDDKSPRYRYPGTKPFEADEYALFKGRTDDVETLSELISLQPLVVLFGRSGLGKSSLLNAGLVNRFWSHSTAVPVFVRFGAYYDRNTASPLSRLRNALTGDGPAANQPNFIYEKLIPREAVPADNLWYVFKSHQLAYPQQQNTVLVFDQFEELFTYPDADVTQFKKELAELLFVSVPQQLRNLLKEKLRIDPEYLTAGEKELLFRPLNVKALFSIRSDKLSLLNGFSDCFPAVLNTCYELKPLTREQARQAIVEPAGMNDQAYASAPFAFTGEAVTRMLDALTEAKQGRETALAGHDTEIETFQLQIVCRHAENVVIERGVREVSAADLGDIKAVFENHYRNILEKLPPGDRLPAQRLMEEKLIIDGNRVSMPIPFILRDEGMGPELLDELINTHLLRREQNNTVEISHDTLVEPILKQYEERRKAEAVAAELREKEAELQRYKAEQERLRKEQEQEAKVQQLKARRNKLLIGVISVALLFMMGLAGYAVKNARIANAQTRYANEMAGKATSEKTRAEANEQTAKKEKGKAERSARIADSLWTEALRQKAIAEENARAALRSARTAQQALAVAEEQRKKVEVSSEAFRLITLARQVAEGDPTIGLRIAEAALKKKPGDSIIQKEAQKIYQNHTFYKTAIPADQQYRIANLSRDGTKIFTRAYDDVDAGNEVIRVWNTEGRMLHSFPTFSHNWDAIGMVPDGNKIVLAGQDSTVRLFDADGRILQTLKVQSRYVHALALSDDGELIVAVGGEPTTYGIDSLGRRVSNYASTLYVWTASGQQLSKFVLPFPISSVAISPDGSKLLTGFTWTTPRLWTLDGKPIREFAQNQKAFSGGIFSPSGQSILVANLDSTAKLWSVDGKLLCTFKGHGGGVRSVAFSADESKILTGSADQTAKLWSADGKLLREFRGHESDVKEVAFSSDGSQVMTIESSPFSVFNSGQVKIWAIEKVPFIERDIAQQDYLSSRAVALSPDGKQVLVEKDSTIELRSATGQLIKTYRNGTGPLQNLLFSPDGKKILVSGLTTSTVIALTGETLAQIPASSTTADFSPDGTKLIIGRDLWKLTSPPEKVGEYEDEKNKLTAVKFSTDGDHVLLASGDNHQAVSSVVLWDGKSYVQLKDTQSGFYLTKSAAFSADGTEVLTGSFDGAIRLWKKNGTLLQKYQPEANDFGRPDGVTAVAFSPDEKELLPIREMCDAGQKTENWWRNTIRPGISNVLPFRKMAARCIQLRGPVSSRPGMSSGI